MVYRIITNTPIPIKIPARKPYRILTDKPLDRWVVVSGFIIVKIPGIDFSAGVAVGIVRLYGFGTVYYSTVMIIVGKALYNIAVFIGERDDNCYVFLEDFKVATDFYVQVTGYYYQ